MKKILSLLLAVIMVVSLAACGGKDAGGGAGNDQQSGTATSSGDAAAPDEKEDTPAEHKVAMVTDYGDVTDQSFNQTTYEACKSYCEAANLPFNYYKPNDNSTAGRVAMVDAAISDGYDILVMPGFAFADTIKETADLYPDVRFIALDVSAASLGDYTLPDNVFCAVYQEELSGYMSGYAAVKLGYRHLGFLGGMANPSVMRFGYGYVQGIDEAAKELGVANEVVVEYVYGNQFSGDADITAYMDTWYGSLGVEVVFSCGGGIYVSAAEASAKAGGKMIGVDVDQSANINKYCDDMTVTSAMKGLSATVKNMLEEIIVHDNWAAYGGKVESLGLVSGDELDANYVQLPLETTQWSDTFSQEDYKTLVSDMFAGKITVSSDTSAMPETAVTVNEYGNIK